MTVVDIVIDQPQRTQSLIKQQFLGFGWKTCSRRFQPLTSCKCSCVALGLRSGLDSTDYFHVIVPPASMLSSVFSVTSVALFSDLGITFSLKTNL